MSHALRCGRNLHTAEWRLAADNGREAQGAGDKQRACRAASACTDGGRMWPPRALTLHRGEWSHAQARQRKRYHMRDNGTECNAHERTARDKTGTRRRRRAAVCASVRHQRRALAASPPLAPHVVCGDIARHIHTRQSHNPICMHHQTTCAHSRATYQVQITPQKVRAVRRRRRRRERPAP